MILVIRVNYVKICYLATVRNGIVLMNSITQKNLLAIAQQLCQQRNVRLTPQRLEVLRLMSQQSGAISAYNLLDLLRIAEPLAKPPTVYRALDFLLDQGFIHRLESANSYILCHHFGQPVHTSALFICDHCSKVTEQASEAVEDTLQKMAQDLGFVLQHSVVEAHGLCTSCIEINTSNSTYGYSVYSHRAFIKK